MKIPHWRQLKDFTEQEVDEFSNLADYHVYVCYPEGGWDIWTTSQLFQNGVGEINLGWYTKDIDEPKLPFTVTLGEQK